jgi:glutamate-1-semialdehyde 2,1-aminomutase
MKRRILDQNKKLLARAEKVIPRASQTLSKAPDQFVRGVSPYAIAKGKGALVWDVDGNEYIDLTSSLGAIVLGYQHPVTERAVAAQRKRGTIFGLPGDAEVALAERLTNIAPFIEMVRFGLNGSDVTTAAVRVARAYTGRDHVAKCGYHGWADWSIATHPLRHGGIPQAVKDLTHEFTYNDIESLKALFLKYPKQIAAVTLEPVHSTLPSPGFLQAVKELAHKEGAVLVFDELVTGFRLGMGGAAEHFGVEPDLVCYGKAISNGEPLSVLAGRKEIMRTLDANNIFFSFTYAGYLPSIRAALATIEFMGKKKLHAQLREQGEKIINGYNAFARAYQVPTVAAGLSPIVGFMFKDEKGGDNLPLKSLFLQECAKRGLLTNGTAMINYAHTNRVITEVLKRLEKVLQTLGTAVQENSVEQMLEGPVIRPRSRPAN